MFQLNKTCRACMLWTMCPLGSDVRDVNSEKYLWLFRAKLARLDFLWEGLFMFRIYTFIHDFCLSFCLAWRNKWAFQTMLTIFLWSNAWFSCIDGVAGIMPIITCPSCSSTNTRFCREKGFVENTRFCRKTGFVANTRLFGFVWCRLLRRHLGFDSDFAQISGQKIGGWGLC